MKVTTPGPCEGAGVSLLSRGRPRDGVPESTSPQGPLSVPNGTSREDTSVYRTHRETDVSGRTTSPTLTPGFWEKGDVPR